MLGEIILISICITALILWILSFLEIREDYRIIGRTRSIGSVTRTVYSIQYKSIYGFWIGKSMFDTTDKDMIQKYFKNYVESKRVKHGRKNIKVLKEVKLK